MRLNGRVAVVTGGASGIGEAVSVRFREEGAAVAVLDLNVEAARLTADVAGGGLAIGTDVSDSMAADAALAEVEDKLGPIDVWINNAGISGRALESARRAADGGNGDRHRDDDAERVDRGDGRGVQEMLNVHLSGTFYGTRAAARSMVGRGTGSIINVASICGIEGVSGTRITRPPRPASSDSLARLRRS
jgi:3-oxoacyl-[acyl-carrier protein] reductase